MQEMKKRPFGLVAGLLIGLISSAAFAHGDVTPHPIDTTGLKPLGEEWITPNPYRGDKKAIAAGKIGYLHNCAGCHGLNVETGGVAPDLQKMNNDCLDMADKDQQTSCFADNDDYFKEIVMEGKKNSEGRYTMPAYGGVFTQEATWAVSAYIDARTREDRAKKGK